LLPAKSIKYPYRVYAPTKTTLNILSVPSILWNVPTAILAAILPEYIPTINFPPQDIEFVPPFAVLAARFTENDD
jgi:hypothetical protein